MWWFHSGAETHCAVPGCDSATIDTPRFGTVAVTVADNQSVPQAAVWVQAYDGEVNTWRWGYTDENGQATLILPEGSYRFGVELHGSTYYSAEQNHCAVPDCDTAAISVPTFGGVTITVSNAGIGQANVAVDVYDGETYTGISAVTNDSGQAGFTLPEGSYRFRAEQTATSSGAGARTTARSPAAMPRRSMRPS